MSITTKLVDRWIALADGGFGGEVTFRKLDADGMTEGEDMVIPVAVVKTFVAGLVRDAKVDKLEDSSDDEVLGI